MTGAVGLLFVVAVAGGLGSQVPYDAKLPNFRPRVARSGLIDFHIVLEQVIHHLGPRHGTEVVWWDYTGFFARQQKEYQQYEKYKVAVDGGMLVYDEPVRVSDTEETVDEMTYHNFNNETVTRKFYNRLRTPQVYTWLTEDALDVYPTPWGSGLLPLELDDHEFLMRVGLDSRPSRYTDDETFELEFTLDVPPATKVQVTWKRVERKVQASWAADITLTGHVAVFFAKPVDGEQLRFYPVHDLVDSDGLTPHETPQGPGLLFHANGDFVGTRTLRLDRDYYFDPL